MKVLGICGSPREGGNTDVLLDKALKGAREGGAETEKIVLNELRFSPCQECENMPGDGSCIINDDMQLVYKKIEEADVLILASPIFFGSLSAQTKMMIDRFQCLWRAKYILKSVGMPTKKKKGAFLCVSAGTLEDFFDNARSIVKNFFATVGHGYNEEVWCPGVEKKGDILKKTDLLQTSFETGKKLATGHGKVGGTV